MKLRFVVISLLLILLYQPGYQIINFVHYCLNQDQIEKSFCVNKAKPKSRCQGTCHLNKVMNRDEPSTREKAPLPNNYTLELNLEFVHEITADAMAKLEPIQVLHTPELNAVCLKGYLKNDIHPPEWIL